MKAQCRARQRSSLGQWSPESPQKWEGKLRRPSGRRRAPPIVVRAGSMPSAQFVIVTPAEPAQDIAVPEPRGVRPALEHNPAQPSNCPTGQGATKGTTGAQLALRKREMISRDCGGTPMNL